MAKIHALAYVDPKAQLADSVEVGPFCYVEGDVVIGEECRLDSHVTVKAGTTMGARNFVGQGAVLGGDPQSGAYRGQPTFLKVGDDNVFREYVTVHRSMFEGQSTVIGSHNFIMAYCHVAHDCTLHDHVTIANSTGLSGHVTVEERAFVGGMCGIHQWSRIGKVSMVGGMTRVTRDVPPFMLAEGDNQEVHDINAIGLRRIGITPHSRLALHKACKLLFKSQLGLTNAMEIVRREVPITDEVAYLLAFEERRFKGRNGRGDQR